MQRDNKLILMYFPRWV